MRSEGEINGAKDILSKVQPEAYSLTLRSTAPGWSCLLVNSAVPLVDKMYATAFEDHNNIMMLKRYHIMARCGALNENIVGRGYRSVVVTVLQSHVHGVVWEQRPR